MGRITTKGLVYDFDDKPSKPKRSASSSKGTSGGASSSGSSSSGASSAGTTSSATTSSGTGYGSSGLSSSGGSASGYARGATSSALARATARHQPKRVRQLAVARLFAPLTKPGENPFLRYLVKKPVPVPVPPAATSRRTTPRRRRERHADADPLRAVRRYVARYGGRSPGGDALQLPRDPVSLAESIAWARRRRPLPAHRRHVRFGPQMGRPHRVEDTRPIGGDGLRQLANATVGAVNALNDGVIWSINAGDDAVRWTGRAGDDAAVWSINAGDDAAWWSINAGKDALRFALTPPEHQRGMTGAPRTGLIPVYRSIGDGDFLGITEFTRNYSQLKTGYDLGNSGISLNAGGGIRLPLPDKLETALGTLSRAADAGALFSQAWQTGIAYDDYLNYRISKGELHSAQLGLGLQGAAMAAPYFGPLWMVRAAPWLSRLSLAKDSYDLGNGLADPYWNPERGAETRARGGRVRHGETTLVGERGPEIVRLPAGSDVIPAHRSRALLEQPAVDAFAPQAGRELHIHQHLDGREVARSTVRNLDDDEQWGRP